MKCKICDGESKSIFKKEVLGKFSVKYYKCSECGFMQTEDPYWLNEAYQNTITLGDTGLLKRNIFFSSITAVLIYLVFGKNKKYLDYAGGYGVFTRLMRDIGFDYYWHDPITNNLFAKGFEYNDGKKIEMLTTFESFEHFVDPIVELEKMLKITPNILFSTWLIETGEVPDKDWWYYGFEHGQHVSFYTKKSVEILADKYGLNCYVLNNTVLMTSKRLNKKAVTLVYLFLPLVFGWVKSRMVSKTFDDMLLCQKREK